MTFTSYSQNFEDVLLRRALGHLDSGFYIDVGANDPMHDSVTKVFYDAGWHGINIEPMPSYRQAFEEQRPRDINLTCAAGAATGELTLFEVPSKSGWASADASVAALHREQGYEVTEARVPVRTMTDICAEHAQADIHFMKIDVEGFEGEVLKGMDFERFRPWIIVIEATLPGTRATNHETWEAMITDHRYGFAWFDGLNRYYVAAEHGELIAALSVQANVFDDFKSYHLVGVEVECEKRMAEVVDLSRRLAEEAAHVASRDTLIAQLQGRLEQTDQQARELAQLLQESNIRLAQLDQHAASLGRSFEERNILLEQGERHAQDLALRLAEAREAVERLEGQLHVARQAVLAAEERSARLSSAAIAAETRLRTAETRAHTRNGHLLAAEERARLAEEREAAAQIRERALQDQLQQCDTWAHGLQARVIALEGSTSWRITAPLRYIVDGHAISKPHLTRSGARNAVLRTLRWISAQEAVRRTLLPVILRFPRLQTAVSRLMASVKHAVAEPAHGAEQVPEPLRDMPQSARRVLADLHSAYQNQPEQ